MELTKLLNKIYKKGKLHQADFEIISNLITFGNAFEYVFVDDKNNITSKIFDNEFSFPIFDDKGNYFAFVEKFTNSATGTKHQTIYLENEIHVIENLKNGVVQSEKYTNRTGLPIQYKGMEKSEFPNFGIGIADRCMGIIDEIEKLLSKAIDTTHTLILNPLFVSNGSELVNSLSIDANLVGVGLALEDGAEAKYISPSIQTETLNSILKTLTNQLYVIGQIPNFLFGENSSNTSQTSLELLYNTTDNYSKSTILSFKEGFYHRIEIIKNILDEFGITINDEKFETIDVQFVVNRPTNNSSLVSDLEKLRNMGVLSVQSIIEQSPYSNNAQQEIERLDKEKGVNDGESLLFQ